ncbi:hypothetical protein CCR85_04875 [Rhodothalassium salexigens]|uniref:DUF4159 domain-containing protein n=1 Tax=Rhodothalassium salexigens TaxID=1086 RepID=UPI001912B028|nr:DUF4159 domain-containing protein [Rhodothalassium salexigens]MBK5910825.1 hypothetical protein [Rhodothalassium salexigens]MBK5919482.1 hypothetical protein [Rhodothalassium salexigens]
MLGALSFSSPALLLALAGLVGLYFIIRALPSEPRERRFPAIRLLRDIGPADPPPMRTPPWLWLLRLLAAGLLILGLAGPVLDRSDDLAGTGPVLLVLDNGWQAAARFDDRRTALDRLAQKAARAGRGVRLITTAPPPGGWTGGADAALADATTAAQLSARLADLSVRPWSPEPEPVARRIDAALDRGEIAAGGAVYYLSDGLAHDRSDRLLATLARAGRLTVLTDAPTRPTLGLRGVERTGAALTATLVRPPRGFEQSVTLHAQGADGRLLAEATARFAPDARTATARVELPPALRNEVRRLHLADQASAGTTLLLDARAVRPDVGLVGAGVTPLRSPLFYLSRALEPFAAVRQGEIAGLIDDGVAMLMLADVGEVAAQTRRRLGDWIDQGGVLIRFAGPRLANADDGLLPVRLRSGDRAFGGALSWSEPQALGPFPDDGPFAGLDPGGRVTVTRQLLAVPSADLAGKTWAQLTDGTPLVTAERRGGGWLVLVHTSANPDWSNLVLNGVFVDMLKRLVTLAEPGQRALAGQGPERLVPLQSLDGFGRLGPADPRVAPLSLAQLDQTPAGPLHPPGYYGPEGAALALNLMGPAGPIDDRFRLDDLDAETEPLLAATRGDRALAPPLLALVAVLLAVDGLVGLWLRGRLGVPGRRWRPGAAAMLALVAGIAMIAGGRPAAAQDAPGDDRLDDAYALHATEATRLAYVTTGDPEVDALSRAGLVGLGRVLTLRTAVQVGAPQAVDPAQDPLMLFPLIYWPVPEGGGGLGPAAQARLNAYLRGGGIVLFDTGAGSGPIGIDTGDGTRLRALLDGVDVPPLMAVTSDHVLARSFYLLRRFPGRLSDTTLWVERGTERADGGVSPLIVGRADWAAAWAVDDQGRYRVASLPGGTQQREMALRFGVNAVMYALTGTYKADSLHLPTVLERLGE